MRYTKLLLIIFALSLLSACSKASFSDNPAQQYQGYSAQKLYVQGKKALASRNYIRAVSLYEALESLYPFGGYAQKAQLDLVYAYYKSGQDASASAAAEQYIRVYPRSQHVDYAYYMKGLADYYSSRTWFQRAFKLNMSLRDLTTSKQAFYDFQQLVRFFPNSKYAPDAKQRMIALRNLFAKHDLFITNYYYKRHAYVAAANRASDIIHHYDNTPQVKGALIMLVKANRKLGLTKEANNALRVLKLNFPVAAHKLG